MTSPQNVLPRRLIQVKPERFDVKSKHEAIEKSVSLLNDYLDTFIPKGRVWTKYSLEGPAGKLISILKSGKLSTKSALIGQITTIHESTGNRLTEESAKKLEKAVDALLEVLDGVPPTKRLRVLSEVDYGLYFERKKKLLEMLARNQEEWISFLKGKYQDINRLNEAWNLTVEGKNKPYSDFSKIDWPTSSFEKKFSENKPALDDLDEFRRRLKVSPLLFSIEEEEGLEGEETEVEEA